MRIIISMAKIQKTDEQWQQELTPEQYRILRQRGTEAPGSGALLYKNEDGTYACAACGSEIFNSETKYDSTTPGLIGWPSFSEASRNDAIELLDDYELGMLRSEVVCKTCGGHLGHLFDDASSPNGKHYCINSLSLKFKKDA